LAEGPAGISNPIPSDWSDLAGYGLFGDYIGGFWGTILSAAALLVLLGTFWSSRSLNYWTVSLSLFAEYLKTHERNAEGVDSREILSEFAYAYQQSMYVNAAWCVRDRVDIAYTYVFYGASSGPMESLGYRYGADRIRELHNILSNMKNSSKYFNGHQHKLSHYMRNLFNAYLFIDNLSIKDKRKYELARLLRTKLSNYDQAVLALNIISSLGREWEKAGLVEAYRPICNVPKDFYGYDEALSLKDLFPTIWFEWEKVVSPQRRYWSWAVGRVTLVLGVS
jgi:hypothetical protein